ncbi:VRR-NUC domain-containing protein [Mammaliicoccus lentus]|uniref:VRR-NUC domain-containing protein n=1 Tax=Mammaliicoccus lentus TaxID=42858 RepID=UPI001C4F4DFA|nr:VRR-NUC domain-containing protein [Mammaliicoccus lentus]MBW0761349.1 VRR-NUC domain-containing protein [Mammaliicoccus lentus]
MKSEKSIEKYLKTNIELLNGFCLKWVSPGTKGVPDRIILMPKGKTYLVELKTEKGKTSATQKYIHKKFKEIDHKVYILNSKIEVDKFIKEVVKCQ